MPQVRALSVRDIRRIVSAIDRTAPRGARDAALILLGFASALRRSELAALNLADLEAKPAGLLLTVARSKTDPDWRGQVVGVVHGQHPDADPVDAVASWLAVRGTKPGPLFTSLRGRRGSRATAGGPITGGTVARILKASAEAAGLPSARISGHSRRAGHVTSAAMAGVGVDRIAALTRHRRIDVLIEP